MEQHISSSATRVTEQPFLGSTMLTSSGGGALKRCSQDGWSNVKSGGCDRFDYDGEIEC